ncbi:MAG TPA: 2-oxo acid dehydrogenase subunit E2 [Rhizomicrobium sp.]|jgi:2-oxoglutarate dehydrogenase E2 component (dihydrolipoamide succinyltransferase)
MDIVAPAEQEGTKAVLKTWLKKPGDAVRADEPIVELETDKVAVEIAAPASGVLSEILIAPESEVTPGTVLGRITEGAVISATTAAPKQAAAVSAPRASVATHDPELRLSPSVRRLVIEHNLDAGALAGSGRGGRLTRADVEAHLSGAKPAPAAQQGVRRVPHDSMRRRIAEHMSHSLGTAPHVTAVFEADFSAIMAHRAAHKAALDVPLTFTAYFVAASALAMQAAPAVNGRWYEDRIEIFDDVNIGIGTALGDKGLVVPVIHRAQTLDLFAVARGLNDLTEKARAGKLSRADVAGGTFSISNHGVSGSLIAAPIIINQPQAAILGVGKLEKRVVVRDDAMVIRPMAYVTLSIDHRMLDGHQTNAWLTRFVEILESWPA